MCEVPHWAVPAIGECRLDVSGVHDPSSPSPVLPQLSFILRSFLFRSLLLSSFGLQSLYLKGA